MQIATLLNSSHMVRLAAAADDLTAAITPAHNWKHLHELLRNRTVSVAVVDPQFAKGVAATEVLRLLTWWPSTPIIAYTGLNTATARALTMLGRRGLREVVFFQVDDARIRFCRILQRAAASRFVARLRGEVHPQLTSLPAHIASTIDDLLERPHAYQAGQDIAISSGAAPRSLQRALHSAGLASPRHLVLGARVAHAIAYLRDPGLRVQDVAIKLGYTRPDILGRHTFEVLQLRPSALRGTDQDPAMDDMLIDRLVAWLIPGRHVSELSS